jgi:hypothetical protein
MKMSSLLVLIGRNVSTAVQGVNAFFMLQLRWVVSRARRRLAPRD